MEAFASSEQPLKRARNDFGFDSLDAAAAWPPVALPDQPQYDEYTDFVFSDGAGVEEDAFGGAGGVPSPVGFDFDTASTLGLRGFTTESDAATYASPAPGVSVALAAPAAAPARLSVASELVAHMPLAADEVALTPTSPAVALMGGAGGAEERRDCDDEVQVHVARPTIINHRATVGKLSTLFARLRRDGYTGRQLWELLRALYCGTPAEKTAADRIADGASFADVSRKLLTPMLHSAIKLYVMSPYNDAAAQKLGAHKLARHFKLNVLRIGLSHGSDLERYQLLERVFHYCSHTLQLDGHVVEGSVLPDALTNERFSIPAECCGDETVAVAHGPRVNIKKRGRGQK